MSTDLAVRTPTVGAHEWGLMLAQADELAKSDIIPSAYRRKPANVVVAALTGRVHGWDVLTAMRNGHVIEGTWGMKPEAMLGLVRAAGHSVTAEVGDDRATVKGKRVDNGDEFSWTFTFEDAEAAGLCKLVDGKPTARSSGGKALPWEQYPKVMCYWRAVSMVCRLLFSDVTLGVHSTEELGAVLDDAGEVIETRVVSAERTPEPLSDDNLARFQQACEAEGLDPERVLDEAFGEGVRPDPLTDADLPSMRDAFRTLSERAGPSGGEPEATADSPSDTDKAEEEGEGRPATRNQVGKIKGEYARLGLTERFDQLALSSEILGGVSLSTHNALTWEQAQQLIEELVKREGL